MPNQFDYDIIIAGAGPTGLALSALLSGQGLSIAIIDRQSKEALANPGYDGREIALTHTSWKILQKTGAGTLIRPDEISLIRNAKVVNGKSPYTLNFSADEVHEDHLGYMIANNVIRKALYAAVKDRPDITLIAKTEITDAATTSDHARVTLEASEILHTRLLIAADSRFSRLRKMIGIAEDRLDFQRTCIVCRMAHEKDLWRTAYECFGVARTLAILPLRNQECSVVITVTKDMAEHLMAMGPDDFAADLERDLAQYCGRMHLVSERFSYPLIGIYAQTFRKRRFTLIGDAAVGMHPVTAHGFNLGLSGANALSGLMIKARNSGLDIADMPILRDYESIHRRASLPLYHGTNALVRLYTRMGPVSMLARQALLRLGNHLTPARHAILRGLTGQRN